MPCITPCFYDGRPAELFLSLYGKGASGSLLEAMGRDSAILASIALQSGVTLATLIEATTAETNGTATSVIGCALRLVRDALDGDPSDAPTSVLPMPLRGGDGAQEIPADVIPSASAGADGAVVPPSDRAVDPMQVAS